MPGVPRQLFAEKFAPAFCSFGARVARSTFDPHFLRSFARCLLKAVVSLLKSEAFAATILPTVGASGVCLRALRFRLSRGTEGFASINSWCGWGSYGLAFQLCLPRAC